MARTKRKAVIDVVVGLDHDDLVWLDEQAYPLGIDAATYLRMVVRQGRLNPGVGLVQPLRSAQPEARYHPWRGAAPSPEPILRAGAVEAPDDGAVDDLVGDALSEAAAHGLIPDPGDAAIERPSTGKVVSLSPRAGPAAGGAVPMHIHHAFGGT